MSQKRIKTASMHYHVIDAPGEVNAVDLGLKGTILGCWDDLPRQLENQKRIERWKQDCRRAKDRGKKSPKKPPEIPFKVEGEDPNYEAMICVIDCQFVEIGVYKVFLRINFVGADKAGFDLDFDFEVQHLKITRESSEDDTSIPIVVKDWGSRDERIVKRRQTILSNIGSHIAKLVNDRIGELQQQ